MKLSLNRANQTFLFEIKINQGNKLLLNNKCS